jgi:hypothetical protein
MKLLYIKTATKSYQKLKSVCHILSYAFSDMFQSNYVIKFVSNLWRVGGFLQVLWFQGHSREPEHVLYKQVIIICSIGKNEAALYRQ